MSLKKAEMEVKGRVMKFDGGDIKRGFEDAGNKIKGFFGFKEGGCAKMKREERREEKNEMKSRRK